MATDLNTLPLPDLFAALDRNGLVRRLLEIARDEDLGISAGPRRPGDDSNVGAAGPATAVGDITTAATIDPAKRGEARVVARTPGAIAGLAAFPILKELFAPGCTLTPTAKDGQPVPAGHTIATVSGPMDEILELERTLLNLVGRLSGIATRTAKFVAALPRGSRAALYDTRKTTPGLRILEKYAVRCGGGRSHRIGLYDAVLIKDNHLAGIGVDGLGAFVQRAAATAREWAARDKRDITFIEVEVDTIEQYAELLALPEGTIDIVLLDNMGPELLTIAATMRDEMRPALQLEASGGITLESIPAIAATGVDRISTGSLTHSAVSLDIALDID